MWRAKRYSFNSNRRKVTITLRRFRLTKKPSHTATLKRYAYNVHLGKLKQISLEYKHPRRNSRSLKKAYRFQTVLSSALIIIGLSGITLSAVAMTRPQQLPASKPFKVASQAKPAEKPVAVVPRVLSKSEPTHINIASQQIDVDLMPVGLAADGSIEVPPVLEWVAGWYKYGPTPGELGPAVIVGHVDSYEGESVFWRLRDVKAGDIVEINRTDGNTARFKITQLAEYDQNNFPTETVYGNTTTAQLRILTCSGTFDTATQHYTQNTVVYAELIS